MPHWGLWEGAALELGVGQLRAAGASCGMETVVCWCWVRKKNSLWCYKTYACWPDRSRAQQLQQTGPQRKCPHVSCLPAVYRTPGNRKLWDTEPGMAIEWAGLLSRSGKAVYILCGLGALCIYILWKEIS